MNDFLLCILLPQWIIYRNKVTVDLRAYGKVRGTVGSSGISDISGLPISILSSLAPGPHLGAQLTLFALLGLCVPKPYSRQQWMSVECNTWCVAQVLPSPAGSEDGSAIPSAPATVWWRHHPPPLGLWLVLMLRASFYSDCDPSSESISHWVRGICKETTCVLSHECVPPHHAAECKRE